MNVSQKKTRREGAAGSGGISRSSYIQFSRKSIAFSWPVENVTNPEQFDVRSTRPISKLSCAYLSKPLKPNVNKKLALFPVADGIISDIFPTSFSLDSFICRLRFCVYLSYENI